MKNLAVILARSGSKGLKNKNVKLLNGKPLMVYSIDAAIKSLQFDCVHVSTDSEDYLKIARAAGADIPFLRKQELASDTANSLDALRFVVEKYKELGRTFDTVTLLQPTSPLRDEIDIRKAFDIFVKKNADSVISVCEMEHSPQICNTLGEDASMNGFIDMKKVGRRQEMPVYYRVNGAIYIQSVKLLMQDGDLYGDKSYAYVMDKRNSVDIDDELDFMFAEVVMKKKLKEFKL